ncbi:predicted protein [Uncinocarpus reesii 1704]|uniref:Methyltransferase type 11 domain-containing protein n=1 Tax=Uncinocarpus reesii (strain UAMH 1704) TaxID=336963 RepID=C4JYY7_UNCRE|nr:uncharacterized protein UREG_07388 [Uncinocarpus reesii 1704]EEP82523.1 predicted protein [Uncinocarpus reesii 1704]
MSVAEQRLEVDSEIDDADGFYYDDQLSSYTASVTKSVTNFPEENGRRYHAFCEGRYLIPNDERENNRLDHLHRMVLGNDLSPIQPSFVPPNVKFIVDDVEADWVYENSPFDFIHARSVELSIKNMPRLVSQAYRALKPGGWFECHGWDTRVQSFDGSTNGTSLDQFNQIVLDGFAKGGYYTRFEPDKMEQWYADAGFNKFHIRKYSIPLGTWPKDKGYVRILNFPVKESQKGANSEYAQKTLGASHLHQAEEGLEGMAMAVLTRLGQWKPEEVRIMVANVRMDFRNRRIHPVFNFYVCYGQRPE